MSPTLSWPGALQPACTPPPLALNTLTWPQVLELLLSGFFIAYFLGDSACLFFFFFKKKKNKKNKMAWAKLAGSKAKSLWEPALGHG